MPLIYITGPTGSGKSTICEALRQKGFEVYDTDDEGMRKAQTIDDKELLTLDLEYLQKLYDTANDRLVFICGTSPTDLDAKYQFSTIILLDINEDEQRYRILHRTNNKYGKEPHQLANALKWRQAQIDKYKNANAVVINATQKIDDITAQILSATKLV